MSRVAEATSITPGPIGAASAGISAVAYAASGNKGKALEMGVTAVMALAPGGAAAAKVGFKSTSVAAKVGSKSRGLVKASRAGCKNSFVLGTLVLMADGTLRPIETLDVGDDVLTADPATGVLSSQDVITPIHGFGDKHLVAISLDGATEPIIATVNHPIWTVETGWTVAENLREGQHTTSPTGATTTITMVEDLGWATQQPVYNLHVSGTHTYYIQPTTNDTPTLVHNTVCDVTPGLPFIRGGGSSLFDKALRFAKSKKPKRSELGQGSGAPKGKQHETGARPSTKGKHEVGQTRKGNDQRGEKGDRRRPYRR